MSSSRQHNGINVYEINSTLKIFSKSYSFPQLRQKLQAMCLMMMMITLFSFWKFVTKNATYHEVPSSRHRHDLKCLGNIRTQEIYHTYIYYLLLKLKSFEEALTLETILVFV